MKKVNRIAILGEPCIGKTIAMELSKIKDIAIITTLPTSTTVESANNQIKTRLFETVQKDYIFPNNHKSKFHK